MSFFWYSSLPKLVLDFGGVGKYQGGLEVSLNGERVSQSVRIGSFGTKPKDMLGSTYMAIIIQN
jgi:hypothetical protein